MTGKVIFLNFILSFAIMSVDTAFLDRCIDTLENGYGLLLETPLDAGGYDLYSAACVKEFELILEQSGKLLRKVLKPYYHSSLSVDKMTFKDVFRNAVLRDLLNIDACERWLQYRDNRNNTAHDYGEHFAEETLQLLPGFIDDARALSALLKIHNAE